MTICPIIFTAFPRYFHSMNVDHAFSHQLTQKRDVKLRWQTWLLSFGEESWSGWTRDPKTRSIKEGGELNGIKLESCSSLKGFPRCQSRWLSSVSRHSLLLTSPPFFCLPPPTVSLASQQAKTSANIFIAADLCESVNVRVKEEGENELTPRPLNSYPLLSTRVAETVFPSFMRVSRLRTRVKYSYVK